MLLQTIYLLWLFSLSVAAKGVPLVPAPSWAPPGCKDLTYTVNVDLPILDLPEVPATLDTPAAVDSYFAQVDSVVEENKTRPLSAQYDIRGRYCPNESKSTSFKPYLFILVHGLTYTKEFWAGYFPGVDRNQNYSLTNYTDWFNIATLSIDLPGHGESTHPVDARELQGPVHKAVILKTLEKIRSKEIIDYGWKKIVYVGHGMGSEIGFQLARDNGKEFVGMVLTGWTQDQSAFPRNTFKAAYKSASIVDPARFTNLSSGYLAMSDRGGREYTQYTGLYPYQTPYQDFAVQGTMAVGEKVQYYKGTSNQAPNFGGHLMIVVPQNDKLYCGEASYANCSENFRPIYDAFKPVFPRAKTFNGFSPPDTGHAWPFHYSGQFVFSVIISWFTWQVYS